MPQKNKKLPQEEESLTKGITKWLLVKLGSSSFRTPTSSWPDQGGSYICWGKMYYSIQFCFFYKLIWTVMYVWLVLQRSKSTVKGTWCKSGMLPDKTCFSILNTIFPIEISLSCCFFFAILHHKHKESKSFTHAYFTNFDSGNSISRFGSLMFSQKNEQQYAFYHFIKFSLLYLQSKEDTLVL